MNPIYAYGFEQSRYRDPCSLALYDAQLTISTYPSYMCGRPVPRLFESITSACPHTPNRCKLASHPDRPLAFLRPSKFLSSLYELRGAVGADERLVSAVVLSIGHARRGGAEHGPTPATPVREATAIAARIDRQGRQAAETARKHVRQQVVPGDEAHHLPSHPASCPVTSRKCLRLWSRGLLTWFLLLVTQRWRRPIVRKRRYVLQSRRTVIPTGQSRKGQSSV